MKTISLNQLRTTLKETIDEANATGEEYTITRHGEPVAVLLGYEDFQGLIDGLHILAKEN